MRHPDSTRQRRACGAAALASLALLAAAVATALAQDAPRPVSGIVYDGSGAVLPDVAVTLEGNGRAKTQARSGPSGQFVFPGVPPGRYVLEAAPPGFTRLRQDVELKAAGGWAGVVTL